MTGPEFLALYPEFRSIGTDQLVATIAEAALSVDPDILASKTDAAVGALTAHKLWISPYGASLRSSTDAGETTNRYFEEFKRLCREMAPRVLVT